MKMNLFVTLKVIVRSWLRNKLYFAISLFSLMVGLACTNLLITFFIHEYNIENHNPERENIFILRQDMPMEEEGKTAYVHINAAKQIKNNYAEVKNILQVNDLRNYDLFYKGNKLPQVIFIHADSTLTAFFDYPVKEGSLEEVLNTPHKVALKESYARKVFGEKSAVGEIIEAFNSEGKKKSFQVAAVLKERPQSLLKFDMITSVEKDFNGSSITLLNLAQGTNVNALLQKIKDDEVPTFTPGETYYHIDPIKEVYFSEDTQSPLPGFLHQANVQLLYIALVSALLVLAIACFNYTNLNFSRTLQQLKLIHIEKLMGARELEIRTQLFLDAILMVMLSFALALLLINDILPLFNGLVSADLPYRFFFSVQVLPLLLVFVMLLSVIPGIYISHRLTRQSLSQFRIQYSGRSKQRIISLLVMFQFVLSLILVYATLIAHGQMEQIKIRASRYEHCIEIGDMMGGPGLYPFQQQLMKLEGIETITLSGNGIMGYTMVLNVKHSDGSTEHHTKAFFDTDKSFFQTMNIRVLEGLSPDEALEKFGKCLYINENYARWMNINPEDIGQQRMCAILKTDAILSGIIENFPTGSLNQQVIAQEITLHDAGASYLTQWGKYLQIRLKPENRKETLEAIEDIWKNMYEGQKFICQDLHQVFMDSNKEVMDLSNVLNTYSLIALFLTCFGVFGISWYAVRQRTREIAIRKVHGASILRILWLLNRPLLGQILVAYIIAMPVAWYIMQQWLEQFVYRAEVSVTHFILPLVVVALVAFFTVSLHSVIAARANPIQSLKIE